MKYIRLVFSYLRKNGWLPVAIMIIPSVVACFLSTPFWEVSFVTAFPDPYISVPETFRVMFGDSWQYVWPVVIVCATQIVGAAYILSAIDRHLRTGKLSLKNPGKMVNNSLVPMMIGVLIICGISIIWRFVLFGLTTFIQVVFASAGADEIAALAVISIISVFLFVAHVRIITPILLWAPIMVVYGYKFRDAAATSFKITSGKKLFIGLFLPLLPCAGLQLLVGFLHAKLWLMRLVGFFVFLYTNVYATVFSIISFYNISDLDRRDVVTYEYSLPSLPTPTRPAASKKAETDGNGKNGKEGGDVI